MCHIEIPGQYDNLHCKPDPELHTRIVGFASSLLTLSSKQRPKRIRVLGNDEKEHLFLVKGGEDLRMDARLQHLFSVMNRVLDQDSACAKRHLQVKTYKVIPMTPDMGLIEWVSNTRPLQNVYEMMLHDPNPRRPVQGSAFFKKAQELRNDKLDKEYGDSLDFFYTA